jgi:hypothetical protein
MLDLPLEYALIKFEDARPTGKIVPELLDLAARGIVRFVDIVFIHKEADGNIRTVELNAVIARLAAAYGVPPIAIATAWITRHPAQMQVVLGTTSPERVTGAALGSDLPLTRPEWYELFVPIGEHVSSLFTNDDLEIAASKLPNNSAAMLILWENLWVANLRKAIVDSGGELVDRAQIAPEVVEEFVQALAAE